MKHTSLLLASLLLASAPAMADTFVESNFTYTGKLMANQSPVNTDTTSSRNYITVSLKNADIIADYAESTGEIISKKARLIRRDRYTDVGVFVSTRFFIRDGSEEYDLTDNFVIDTPHMDYVIEKYKYSETKGTGTRTQFVVRDIDLEIPWEFDGDDFIYAHGFEKTTRRTVLTKEDQLTHLDSINYPFHGEAYFYNLSRDGWFSGLIQGAIKASGPKVVVPQLQ